MKKTVFFCSLIIGMVLSACQTQQTSQSKGNRTNDVEKMGYHGKVKTVKIEEYTPDKRAGEGLALSKTSNIRFDESGRLMSSIGLGNVNKTCNYGENGKVSEIVELYRDIKMHAFHSYDKRGNCTRIDLYKVYRGDSTLVEVRTMEYNDKDSIISYSSMPKVEATIQTVIHYGYDKNDCFVEKKVYSAPYGEELNTAGDVTTHIRAKFDDQKRPIQIDKMSLVDDIYTKDIEYNDNGDIAKEILHKPDAQPVVTVFEYTYNSEGKRAEAIAIVDGVKSQKTLYDDKGMKTVSEWYREDGIAYERTTYEYDAEGNIVTFSIFRIDPKTNDLIESYREVRSIEYHS
ncbi:hypothetical protein [Porphyromonas sp.]|uniref:hypothetical protein n=1 Tax=Porphyromonas sp. TaxID=1924944 RepID=UPI0026DC242B|nr:hypothetical protein [Porphyromonas sp.]MDO4770821.1 hypothetical protein [Porphyromonas sp.]